MWVLQLLISIATITLQILTGLISKIPYFEIRTMKSFRLLQYSIIQNIMDFNDFAHIYRLRS